MTKPINEVNAEDVALFAKRLEPVGECRNVMDTYQELAVRSAIYPGKGSPFGLMYVALGLAEAGEAQNKVKKLFRDDGVIYFGRVWHEGDNGERGVNVIMRPISDERRQQIAKELGGLLWYVAATCKELDISMSQVAAMNLKELADRAKRGTLSGDGDNR